MTSTVTAARRSLDIELDWVTATLVALFAGFQLLTLYAVGMEFAPPQQQSSSVAFSGRLFAILLIEVVVIVSLWRGWQYLPQWTQTIIKYATYAGAFGVLLGVHLVFTYGLLLFGTATAAAVYAALPVVFLGVLYAVIEYTQMNEYLWIAFNLAAFTGGILATVMASHMLAPIALIPLMIAVMVYDYLAVDLTSIMSDLIDISTSAGIPNYLIIPTQPSLDMAAVREYVSGNDAEESPESVAFIIGIGDFVFPTALAASTYIAHGGVTAAVVGALAGTLAAAVTLRAALAGGERLPALPWLNTGSITGYAVGTVVMLAI